MTADNARAMVGVLAQLERRTDSETGYVLCAYCECGQPDEAVAIAEHYASCALDLVLTGAGYDGAARRAIRAIIAESI